MPRLLRKEGKKEEKRDLCATRVWSHLCAHSYNSLSMTRKAAAILRVPLEQIGYMQRKPMPMVVAGVEDVSWVTQGLRQKHHL